jgi:hypothetical protein
LISRSGCIRGVVEGVQSGMFLVSDHTGANDEHLLRTPDAPEGRRDDFVDPYFRQAKTDEVVVILKAR